MSNKMTIWLAYDGTDETYAYEFNNVSDDALIEASVQAAVQAFNTRIQTSIGSATYGHLFMLNNKTNPATSVAKVTAVSSHEVPITISGGN